MDGKKDSFSHFSKNGGGLQITDLIELETLQRLQDCFADATGVASIITDPEGRPITKPSNFCRLCMQIIRGCEKGCANCMKSDAILGKLNPGGPLMAPCMSGGLWDGGASICVGERHIANWLVGQVRNDETPKERVLAYADEIGVDKAEFEKALDEVKVMSTAQFSKVCNALYLIANQISDLAYKNLALKESESNLQTTLNSIGDAVVATDIDGRVSQMNPVAESLTGWTLGDANGKPLEEVLKIVDSSSKAPLVNPGSLALKTGTRVSIPASAMLVDKNGVERLVADSASPILDSEGALAGAVVVFRDVSEQRLLEEQLRQSHKMEAVGRLAGGVAHDFNNMLGGILGAAELLAKKVPSDSTQRRLVDIIIDATMRAADLTRKLLDFSRKGMRDSAPLDLHKLIQNSLAILERSLDKKVAICASLSAEAAIVDGDAAQLQSAFMNLCINARDAMPNGGKLSISTRNIDIDKDDSRFLSADAVSGPHIELGVSDTGVGMPPEVQRRLFEPFFTTKEVGKGTGLGLAAVYGAVREHRGAIHVYSEQGKGSVFKVYLPLSRSHLAWRKEKAASSRDQCKVGRILLVDDEPLIRSAGQLLLEYLGNEVVLAADGAAAVDAVEQADGRFDLVIMDMIMPKMNGREAFAAITLKHPETPFIFASGFTRDQDMDALIAHENVVEFISKPYKSSTLQKALEKVIARKRSS